VKKALLLVALILSIFIGLIFIPTHKQENKPYIAVTNFALYEITSNIVKERVEVKNLIPFGVEVHSYMPSVKTMTLISNAKLFVFNGLSMEPWIKKEYPNQLNMSQFVSLKDASSGHKHLKQSHSHAQEDFDPHYWLDLENMQKMTEVLRNKLRVIAPEHKEMYEKNRDTYIKMLNRLDSLYRAELSSCKIDSVILNHNSLGYLAEKYHFNVDSLSGLSPEAESSASDIKRVLQEISQSGVRTIFYESFVNAKVIQTIASDSHVEIDVLQPLGNITADEASVNATYESLMLVNLNKLSKAMLCH